MVVAALLFVKYVTLQHEQLALPVAARKALARQTLLPALHVRAYEVRLH